MSFDYQKLKAKNAEAEGSMWTSYSDLFMVLSVVFLLLYVVASLRSGTSSVQQQIENQKLKNESEDLRRQIQAYNTLKEDYVAKEASAEEAKTYEELMSKLSLLQDEATQEKNELEAKAKENAEKAVALNQYQQLVRNIINTNMLAKKRIKVRDDLIVKRNDTIKELDATITEQTQEIQHKAQIINAKEGQIAEQTAEIQKKQELLRTKEALVSKLSGEIQTKESVIRKNETQITSLNSDLTHKIKELEKTASSKADLGRKVALMKLENARKVKELQAESKSLEESLKGINQELSQASGQLKDANQKISEQEAYKAKLEGEIKDAQEKYKAQMAEMEKTFKDKISAERGALEKALDAEKASAQEKAKRLAEFKAQAERERGDLDKKLSDLKGQVANAEKAATDAQGKLAAAKKEHSRYLASIDKLKKDNEGLTGDLGRATEIANAKKNLANKISKNLAKNGIKAGVDPKSGDVTINFGDEYFDTGKHDLKENMKAILKKFIPIYSRSLFDDKNVAKEILSVEVVGFSSPTYKGKYVDPQSLAEQDRAAVAYNLDLSYYRARSIFSYIFDQKTMTYDYQKELLPIVKVTGRSFLAEEVKGRNIASGISHKDYCAQHNCEKSQKVIIRFNLKD